MKTTHEYTPEELRRVMGFGPIDDVWAAAAKKAVEHIETVSDMTDPMKMMKTYGNFMKTIPGVKDWMSFWGFGPQRPNPEEQPGEKPPEPK